MNSYLQLAWRNLWRNKRRTLITAASVFFGVVLSAYMTSMQEGSYAQYIKTIVNSYSGDLQVHKNGYSDDQVLKNSFAFTPEISEKISSETEVTLMSPRLETFALASGQALSKNAMILGIQPSTENQITHLTGKIISGTMLNDDDRSIMVGSMLAKYLKLKENDTLRLIGQNSQGLPTIEKFPVKAIIKQASPELDRSAIYIPVKACQQFLSMPDKITSLVLMTNNSNEADKTKKLIQSALGEKFEVVDWKQMNKILLTQIESDRASGAIMKGVLFLIIAFGIFSTVMMMTLERRKEFAVLRAVGMRKYRLGLMLYIETIIIGLIGSLAGILFSIPLLAYSVEHPIKLTGQGAETMAQMGFEPVMTFSADASIFITQAVVILCFTLLIGLYPLTKIYKMKISKAMRD